MEQWLDEMVMPRWVFIVMVIGLIISILSKKNKN